MHTVVRNRTCRCDVTIFSRLTAQLDAGRTLEMRWEGRKRNVVGQLWKLNQRRLLPSRNLLIIILLPHATIFQAFDPYRCTLRLDHRQTVKVTFVVKLPIKSSLTLGSKDEPLASNEPARKQLRMTICHCPIHVINISKKKLIFANQYHNSGQVYHSKGDK